MDCNQWRAVISGFYFRWIALLGYDFIADINGCNNSVFRVGFRFLNGDAVVLSMSHDRAIHGIGSANNQIFHPTAYML